MKTAIPDNKRQMTKVEPPEIEAGDAYFAASRRWVDSVSDTPGPRQVKKVRTLIRKLRILAETYIKSSDKDCIMTIWAPYRNTVYSEYPAQVLHDVGTAFGWEISRKNAARLAKALEAELPASKRNLAWMVERLETDDEYPKRAQQEAYWAAQRAKS